VSCIDAEQLILKEFKRMIDLWECGRLYYHVRVFLYKFARGWWIGKMNLKEPICACLALSRLGLPITTHNVAWILKDKCENVNNKLSHLASYKVLEPIEPFKHDRFARRYKLTSEFIEYIYKKLVNLPP
jgi:hypothetical protein